MTYREGHAEFELYIAALLMHSFAMTGFITLEFAWDEMTLQALSNFWINMDRIKKINLFIWIHARRNRLISNKNGTCLSQLE